MPTTARPRRILIIDDEPGILEVLNHYLRSLDFEPFTTTKWTEALNQITHNPPDLILLDLRMPTVQGDAILEFLQQQGHAIPVIVISAHLDPERVEKISRLGARRWISKPFQLNEVADAIREELGDVGAEVPAAAPPSEAAETPVKPVKPTKAAALPFEAAETPVKPVKPTKAAAPPFEAAETPGKQTTPTKLPPPSEPAKTPAKPGAAGQSAYSALDHEIAEMTSSHAHASPSPDTRGHRHHRQRRKKTNVKLYVIVALACVFASLVVLVIEKLPGWMSGTFDQVVEKSMQSEIRKQTKGMEGISDKQKEALRKAMESQGK